MSKPQNNNRFYLISALLILATLAVYWQVVDFDFTNFDDDVYVYENPAMQAGLVPSTIRWALTTTHTSLWQPVVWISYLIDTEINGIDPQIFHVVNVLFHLANTLLLFFLLSRITGFKWRSAFIAALFAIHPLHVESVAWVAERKDVVSTFFMFLTIWAYLNYIKRPEPRQYLLILIAFVLGLMSKSMLVTLPVLLLLLDYWPLRRLIWTNGETNNQGVSFYNLVREKIPLFILSAISGIITIYIMKTNAVMGSLDKYPIGVRIANSFVAHISYIVKMFWPQNLAVFYPHPVNTLPVWQVIGSAILFILISAIAVRCMRSRPYILVGWLWYVISLFPVNGLMQQGEVTAADHFTYIPLIGLFIIVAWGVLDLLGMREKSGNTARAICGILAVTSVSALMVCAYIQTSYWRNSITLFTHALKVTDKNPLANCNLGAALEEKGLVDDAIAYYRRAINILPNYTDAHYNLATTLMGQEKFDESISHFLEAIRINPKNQPAYNNLGSIYAQQGQLDKAIVYFSKALELDPYDEGARNNLEQAKALKQYNL